MDGHLLWTHSGGLRPKYGNLTLQGPCKGVGSRVVPPHLFHYSSMRRVLQPETQTMTLNIYLDVVVYKKLQLKGHRRGLCSDIVHYSSSNVSIQSALDSVMRLTCSGNKGFRRLQEPPSFQSPPSKCLGDWVRKNLIAPGFSLFSTNITYKKHNNYKPHNEIACIGLVLYTQKRL